MASDRVSVIVVCTNEKHHLPVCLGSLRRQTYPDLEVIVVDNGSRDGSAEYLASEQPWVRVHSIASNVGYASANNAGFAIATGRYLVVLNADTEVDPNFVAGLLEAFEDDRVGLATSRICLFGNRDLINASGNNIHVTGIAYCRGLGEPKDHFKSADRVAAVSGCAFMIRRDVLDRLGGFDDDYFVYVEDTDLSLRANLAGYRIVLAPNSIVYHKYSLKMSPNKFYFLERNRRQTLMKNWRWGTLVAMFPPLLVTGLLMWTYAVLHGPDYLRAKFRAHIWIYRNWTRIMNKRRRVQATRVVADRQIVGLLSSNLPANQVIGSGLFPRVAGGLVNLAFSLLAVPVRIFG